MWCAYGEWKLIQSDSPDRFPNRHYKTCPSRRNMLNTAEPNIIRTLTRIKRSTEMNYRHLAPQFEIKSILSLNNTSLIRIY